MIALVAAHLVMVARQHEHGLLPPMQLIQHCIQVQHRQITSLVPEVTWSRQSSWW